MRPQFSFGITPNEQTPRQIITKYIELRRKVKLIKAEKRLDLHGTMTIANMDDIVEVEMKELNREYDLALIEYMIMKNEENFNGDD